MQITYPLQLPGPDSSGQTPSGGQGIQSAATTAPTQLGTGNGGGGGGSSSGGSSGGANGGSQPGSSSTGGSPGGGSTGAGGRTGGSGSGQLVGNAAPTGGSALSLSSGAPPVTTATPLPIGCVEDNTTCAGTVCQLGHMSCGNSTAFRCAALNCGGTCLELCVAMPSDWGPTACPDISGVSLDGCIPCATNNCAAGKFCKAYEAGNRTWFCSNPCAYTCEPQAV